MNSTTRTTQPSAARRCALALILVAFAALGAAGCAAPQQVHIETEPVGAHIYVAGEYVGISPIVYEIPNVGPVRSVEIRARMRNVGSDGVVLAKKSNGYFPQRAMIVLDDTVEEAHVVVPAQASAPVVVYPPIVTGQQTSNYTGPSNQSGPVVPAGPVVTNNNR